MTTPYRTIQVIRNDDGYATLVLDRPDKFNTLSNELRGEMIAAVAALEADPGVRVLIVTGAGRAFTAGMDLDEWRNSDKLAATHMAAARCFEEGRFNDMRMPAMGSQIATCLRQMEKTIEGAPR